MNEQRTPADEPERVGGFAEGDWVACDDPEQPRIARVKEAYETDGQVFLNLVLYRRDGTRVGRVSPACGGPRGFEPAVPAAHWGLIEEPGWKWLAVPRYHWGDRVRWVRRPSTQAPTEVAHSD